MKCDKGTLVRTAVLLLSLINSVLQMFDLNPLPIENETVSQAISSVLLIASAIASWWKNNSFSKKAVAADEYLKELKGGK